MPTQLIKEKRNSLKPTFPFLCQSISSAFIHSSQWDNVKRNATTNLLVTACHKKWVILNRDLEMCAGGFSLGEVSFSAFTKSFLFSFPSPFLSRNKNASIIISKVASSCGDPTVDVWKKLIDDKMNWQKMFTKQVVFAVTKTNGFDYSYCVRRVWMIH